MEDGKEKEGGEVVTPEEAYDKDWDSIEREEIESKDTKGKKEPEKKDEKEGEKKEPEPEEVTVPKKEWEGVQKSVKDTKQYATKLTQDLLDARKEIDAFKKGEGSSDKVDEQIKKAEEAEKALTDQLTEVTKEYPELKDPLNAIVGKLGEFGKEIAEMKKGKAEGDKKGGEKSTDEKIQADAVAHFEAVIKPEIVKVHEDFDAIVKDPDQKFWTWAAQQSQADQFAAFHSSDPADMTRVLTNYKKELHAGKVQDLKKEQDDKKAENLKNAMTSGGGSGGPALKKEGGDDNANFDYDTEWDKAGEELAREGIR